jgi:endonuclease YncB( thermonuclease family)
MVGAMKGMFGAVLLAAVVAAGAAVGVDGGGRSGAAAGSPASCTVERVIDGDTFVCEGGMRVRMLQINAPEAGACGGPWATAALANIFLRPGTNVGLEYDEAQTDRYGRTLAAPIVRGTDGADYNISIVMVYVGLAKAAYYGDNSRYLEWARAAESWARTAEWNMWAPGGPFAGAQWCGA